MESKPVSELSAEQLASLFNEAFKGYIGVNVSFTAETLTRWLADNFISLPLSHVFFSPSDPKEPIAFGLIATRPDKPRESRLGAMGVVPAFKGRGIGSRALGTIIAAERARGVSVLELEVIQKNDPAVNLYQRSGFAVTRELVGWQRDPPAPGEFETDAELQPCSFEEVDTLVKTHGADDLPWQAWGFRKSSDTARAFKLGQAYCVVTNPEDEQSDTVNMRSLIVAPGSRGKGDATRLIKAMMGRFPGKKWAAGPVFPKEYGIKIAKQLGFEAMEIAQYQMRLYLE
jgi:ribosomal protein S18 acetylase RimI-like enzyme